MDLPCPVLLCGVAQLVVNYKVNATSDTEVRHIRQCKSFRHHSLQLHNLQELSYIFVWLHFRSINYSTSTCTLREIVFVLLRQGISLQPVSKTAPPRSSKASAKQDGGGVGEKGLQVKHVID